MKRIIITLIVMTLLPIAVVPFVFSYAIKPVSNESETEYFEIKQGDTARSVGLRLQSEGFIKYSRLFSFLAKHLKYDKRLLAGFYEINKSMGMIELLEYLNSGKQVMARFTIPEGKNIYDIADYLDSLGLLTRDDFLAECHNPKILSNYQIPAPSVEGYLYPSTYYIVKGNKAERFVTLMIDSLFKAFPKEKLKLAGEELGGYSVHQLLTMASIIEKEMGFLDDPTIIASVYYNRLKLKMRLQADPTTIYAMVLTKQEAIPTPNIRSDDLRMDHPYNTYKVTGLPPGPISGSGYAAINAALNPAETEYIFFIADGSGKSIFTRTYEEHLRNIDRYILKKRP